MVGRLLALPASVKVREKLMEVANALAYYDPVTITVVKKFYGTGPEKRENESKYSQKITAEIIIGVTCT
jgi:hypothetical protein